MFGDHAVRHLMENQRTEKQQAGENGQCKLLRAADLDMQGPELCEKRIRDQRKDEEPTGMQEDGDTVNPPESNPFTAHRNLHPQVPV